MISNPKIRRAFKALDTLVIIQGGSCWAGPGDMRDTIAERVREYGVGSRDALFKWLAGKGCEPLTPNDAYYFAHLCGWAIRIDDHGQMSVCEFQKVEGHEQPGSKRARKKRARRART